MLPFWLKHHRNLFDHGVMIDYNSTDASCDIIRSLCPHWSLVQTGVGHWANPAAADAEVMAIERGLGNSCYKMALNVTEFLMHWDLNEFLNTQHPAYKGWGFRTQGFYMFDPPELKNTLVDPDQYLVLQRAFGCREANHLSRSRLFHCQPDGAYNLGRHETHHAKTIIHPGFYLLWYNWSPYLEMMSRGTAMRKKHRDDLQNAGKPVGAAGGLWAEEGWAKEEGLWRVGGTGLSRGIDGPPRDLTADPWFAHIQQQISDRW